MLSGASLFTAHRRRFLVLPAVQKAPRTARTLPAAVQKTAAAQKPAAPCPDISRGTKNCRSTKTYRAVPGHPPAAQKLPRRARTPPAVQKSAAVQKTAAAQKPTAAQKTAALPGHFPPQGCFFCRAALKWPQPVQSCPRPRIPHIPAKPRRFIQAAKGLPVLTRHRKKSTRYCDG